MKLNLKQVLALNGMAKPRFDSGRRRGLYGFMYEAYESEDAVATYENSRNRFGIEHAVGIACVEYGMSKLGLSADIADSIVSNNFGHLLEAVNSGAIDPGVTDYSRAGKLQDHFFVGALFFIVGRGHYAGSFDFFQDQVRQEFLRASDGGHADSAVAGVVMIDATTAYREIKAKLLSGLSL